MNFKITLIISTWFVFSADTRFTEFGNFAALRSMPYFVDKTEILKILFSDSSSTTSKNNTNYHFVTCPYNFGKNVNFLMIKEFAELEIDQNRKPKIWLHTQALNNFKDLKISQYPDIISNHMAKYPVVYLSLWIPKDSPIQDPNEMLMDALLQSVEKYKWLVDILSEKGINAAKTNYNIDPNDAQLFVNLFSNNFTFTTAEIKRSLFSICRLLYNYFNKTKVVLLVDEYEKVALRAFATANKEGIKFYEQLKKILNKALDEGREYIKFALMAGTGSLGFSVDARKFNLLGFSFGRPLKRDLVTHYPFLDEHLFTPYFGFVEKEVISMCRLNYTTSNCDIYEPGLLGEAYMTIGGRKVNNPASVTDIYARTHLPPIRVSKFEWIEPDFNQLLESFAHSDVFRKKMEEADKQGYFQYPIKKSFPSNALKDLIALAKQDFSTITPKHVDMFFTVAFEQGYFTHIFGENNFSFPNTNFLTKMRQQMCGLSKNAAPKLDFEAVLI